MLDTQPIFIDAADPPISIFKQAVAGNGTQFLAVWSEVQGGTVGDIYGTRITPDGVSLDSTGFLITTEQELCDVVFDGIQFLVHAKKSSSEIAITPITPSGEVGQTTLVSSRSTILKLPAVSVQAKGKSCLAWAGWVDSFDVQSAYTWRIHGRLFNSGITAIDVPVNIPEKTGIAISADPHRQTLSIKYTSKVIAVTESRLRVSINVYTSKGQNLAFSSEKISDRSGNLVYRTYHLRSMTGFRLPAGIYFVNVTAGNAALTKKVFFF